jgi:hypothetical protein
MVRAREKKLLLLLVVLAVCAGAAVPGDSSAASSTLQPATLARARVIRSAVTSRYVRAGLAVTEASSTGVVESFTLLTADLQETRIIDADNGVYYAICPARASCPYPARRFARPAADVLVRRLALELALRTFLETSADVVAVSLPTRRFVLFVVERDELRGEVDVPTLSAALTGDPSRPLAASLERVVDRVTRSRVFLFLGLEATPSGRQSWAGVPCLPRGSAT